MIARLSNVVGRSVGSLTGVSNTGLSGKAPSVRSRGTLSVPILCCTVPSLGPGLPPPAEERLDG